MLQPARGIVVEKVFQPAKVSTSLRKRFSNQLKDSLPNYKPFRRRVLYLAATMFSWRTFCTTSPRAGCKLGLLENLFDESSSCLEPLLVGTFSTNESSSWLEHWLVGKPFRRGCNQLEYSTSKRFSKQLRLQLARGFIVEKIFQPAKVATSSRSRCRKGFQISQSWKQLGESWLKKCSNQLRLQPAWGKGFPTILRTPWLIGKPFRRRVLYLVATLFSWRTFCTTSPRAGCNLGLLENLFDESSSCLESWLVGTFSMNESSSWLEPWLVGKPFRRGCNQLKVPMSERFSKQLRLQLAWGLMVKMVFQPAKVATSLRSRRRKGFQISQCCNQHEESSLKKFSNRLRFRLAWGKGFLTSSRTPCLTGKLFRRWVLYLVATLFSRRSFSTTSPRAGCNLGLLENLFDETSRCLEPWLVGTFSTHESSSRLEWVGKLFRRGCNQLDDSMSKRLSQQPKLQLAWGLNVEKIFHPAKVATSSRSRRRKGFQVRQCCNQLEESSLKKFSNQLRFRPAWGKGFATGSRTPW